MCDFSSSQEKFLVDFAKNDLDAWVMAKPQHPPKIVNELVPGFYLVRYVPGGWAVPARIGALDDRYWFEHDGKLIQVVLTAEEAWAIAAHWITGEKIDPIARIIVFGEPCDETTYRHRLALRRWAYNNAPWHPCLHPDKPMDSRLLPAADF